MKRFFVFAIVAAAAALLVSSCHEEPGIISTFDFSVSLPVGKIVDGNEAVFKVSSNREWSLDSFSLSDGCESDIDFAQVEGFLDGTKTYPAGVSSFKIPAEGVSVRSTHKGRFTISGKDVVTGTVKSSSATYSAFVRNQYELIVETPVVHNGEEFVFSIYSPTASSFTLVKCNLALSHDSVVEGKVYELDPVTHKYTFTIPVKVQDSIINGELSITVTDDSGEVYELDKEVFSVLSLEATLTETDTKGNSVSMHTEYWLPDDQIVRRLDVRCTGGFTVKMSDESEGCVAFSESYMGFNPQESLEYKSGHSVANVYFYGTKPGNVRIVVSPTVAKGDPQADVYIDVWVKPMTVLYVGGDFAFSRNRVLALAKINASSSSGLSGYSYTINNLEIYNDEISGGWTAAPNSISYKLVPIGEDANLDSRLTNFIRKSVVYPENVSLFGAASASTQYVPLNDVTRMFGAGFFTDVLSQKYPEIKSQKFDLSMIVDMNGGNLNSKNFWWDGSGIAFRYVDYDESSYGIFERYSHGNSMSAVLASEGKRTFVYSGIPVDGGSDRVSFSERDITLSIDGNEVIPIPGSFGARLVSGTMEDYAAGNYSYLSAQKIYPYKQNYIIPGEGDEDGITCFLNRWNDVLVESGAMVTTKKNNKVTGRGILPDGTLATDSRKKTTEWSSFGVRVNKLSYDQQMFDIACIVYGFEIFDESKGQYVGGADFWWHSVNSSPFIISTLDSSITVTDKN